MSALYYSEEGRSPDGTIITSYCNETGEYTELDLDGSAIVLHINGDSELTLADGSVTVENDLVVSGSFGDWIALPYRTVTSTPQWDDAGSTFSPGQYRKVGDMVQIEGKVAIQVVETAPNVIGTLPAGYRPSKIKSFVTYTDDGIGYVEIGADGVITLQAGGVAAVLLDGIQFSVL